MMHSASLLILAAGLIFSLEGRSVHEKSRIRTSGPEVVSFRVLPFGLNEVKLLEGPFLHARA
jgi:uncharacterized protein